MKKIKCIFAVVLGLVILTALIGFAVTEPSSTAVPVPAAVIHHSGGFNPTLLGSTTFHHASATGGFAPVGGGSR